MDLEQMRRLTQNMEDVNSGTNNSGISLEEAKALDERAIKMGEPKSAEEMRIIFELFKKSAEAGYFPAMDHLSIMYEHGHGTQKDERKGFYWCKKAAEGGYLESVFTLGLWYYYGQGTDRDIVRAFSWFKKAADSGHTRAMHWTAGMYRRGEGVVQDCNKAIEWYTKAAEKGYVNSMVSLGSMYGTGEGIPKNPALSAKWHEKAANEGDAAAQNNLGYAYVYGIGVSVDFFKGIHWLEKAANQGNKDAMVNLANVYEMLHNVDACIYWYKKAASLGDEDAIQWLNKVKSNDSCFITTAVCDSFGKADDCYELTAFRNFRDKWLALQADGKNLIAEYYEVAPKIVEKINSLANSAEIYKNIWRDYLSKCLKSIEVGDNLNCKKIYVEMVNTLKEKFLNC